MSTITEEWPEPPSIAMAISMIFELRQEVQELTREVHHLRDELKKTKFSG
jgi:hypothetical protein